MRQLNALDFHNTLSWQKAHAKKLRKDKARRRHRAMFMKNIGYRMEKLYRKQPKGLSSFEKYAQMNWLMKLLHKAKTAIRNWFIDPRYR